MAIAFDNSKSQYEDRPNTDYFTKMSFTVGSGSNRILIVGLITNNRSVSSVTYNGVEMTALYNRVDTSYGTSYGYWYLLNPDAGTHDIVANLSLYSNGETIFAVSLSGVSGVGSSVENFTQYSYLTTKTTNIIPTSSASWLVDFLTQNSNVQSATVGSGQTIRVLDTIYGKGGISTKENTSTSQKSMTWNFGNINGQYNSHTIVEVIDANPPVTGSSKFFQLFN